MTQALFFFVFLNRLMKTTRINTHIIEEVQGVRKQEV